MPQKIQSPNTDCLACWVPCEKPPFPCGLLRFCCVCLSHCWVHVVDAELLLFCQHIAWHAVKTVGGGTFSFKILLWHDWFTLKLAVRSIVLIPWKFFCFTIQHIPFALPFDLPPWSHAYSCTTKNFCCLLNTVTNWSADVDTKLAGEEVAIINHILISIDWSN